MIKNRTKLIGIVCFACPIAVWFLYGAHTADPSPSDSEPQDTVAESMSDRGLDAKNAPKDRRQRIPIPNGAEFDATDEPSILEEDLSNGISAEEFERQQKQWTVIQRAFFSKRGEETIQRIMESEKTDAKWLNEIEIYSKKMLADNDYLHTQLKSLDCRQRFCKIEFYHGNEAESDRFNAVERDNGPWSGDKYGKIDDLGGGQKVTWFYFSKPEYGATPFTELKNQLEREIAEENRDHNLH